MIEQIQGGLDMPDESDIEDRIALAQDVMKLMHVQLLDVFVVLEQVAWDTNEAARVLDFDPDTLREYIINNNLKPQAAQT